MGWNHTPGNSVRCFYQLPSRVLEVKQPSQATKLGSDRPWSLGLQLLLALDYLSLNIQVP